MASNIAYGVPETPRAEIERAARQANCEFIWDLKDGFDTKSECPCVLFSQERFY